jgi:hypothetical protein
MLSLSKHLYHAVRITNHERCFDKLSMTGFFCIIRLVRLTLHFLPAHRHFINGVEEVGGG